MRSKNMQALTDDIKAEYPGVTVYGIGDARHKLSTSDHNEDDTSGSKAAQTDDDSVPEHRAIDVMLGSAFTREQAKALVLRMVADEATRARLFYVIFDHQIWRRRNNWVPEAKNDEPHEGHVHFSGLASDDENGSPWPIVHATTAPAPPAPQAPATPAHRVLKKGMSGVDVRHLQQFLRDTFPAYRDWVLYMPGRLISVDDLFGGQTEAWVKEFQRRCALLKDGVVGPNTLRKLRAYGYKY